jgi:hypothetical protein
MTVINTADKIYVGTSLASKVYAGTNQVWPPAAAYDPATTAWINAVVAAGGTVSSGRKTLVDNLIVGLKADGLWTKFDRLWVFAAENQKSALIDLKALSSANPSTLFADLREEEVNPTSAPVFTVNRGFTCDGTATVNTGFIPSTHGVQFTMNTAHASVWSLTSAQNSSYTAFSGHTNLFAAYVDGNTYFRINNNAGGAGANTDGSGFFLAVRTAASGAGAIMGYRNGVNIANTADGAATLDAAAWLVNDRQISSTSVGGTMNGTDSTNYYNRLRTYMTAVGVP